ncbi:adenosine deaminase [Rubrimonas sp.]|uniref:adenosine deaminase n=1 Tax=Rubrimonas sp. TaxID=2036015 RepID=UPI002FDEF5DF
MNDAAAEAPLPKVELHLHLEGAAPPALTRRVAAAQGADCAGMFDAAGGYLWRDFGDFLRLYDRVAALYRRPEDVRALTEAALAACARDGAVYVELTLSPDHAGGEAALWAEHLAAVAEGAAAAQAAHGVEARCVAIGVRHFGPEAALRAARLAADAPHPILTGFGLAGDERAGRAEDFAPAFALAREAGLGLTAHAGEFAGPDSVRAALDLWGVRRIGHGVRAVENRALVDRVAAEGVVLEVCPGSNVALGAAPDWPRHPIHALARAGCRVTVSTDDPPFFATSLAREDAELARCGWTRRARAQLARTALDAAFCDAATKMRLAALLPQDAPASAEDYPAA